MEKLFITGGQSLVNAGLEGNAPKYQLHLFPQKGSKTGNQLRRDGLVGYRYFVIPVGRLPLEDQLHMDERRSSPAGLPRPVRDQLRQTSLGFLGFAQKALR